MGGEDAEGAARVPAWPDIAVIAPNLKRRLSGVTTTVVRLIPTQARTIGIVTTGPGLPPTLPHLPLWRVAMAPRDRWRVWHARRNVEMLAGLILTRLLRRRFRLLFTSAAQRRHSVYTRWLIRRMDAVVATSPQAASYLERPATVIMHGIDLEALRPAKDKASVRRGLGLPAEGTLIGCFGRLRAQKGTDVLIDACLTVLPRHPGTRVILTGRELSDQRAFMDAQRAKLAAAGLTDRVTFLGERPWSEMERLYRALDLFIAPARWEGFGLTPIEAMASGVPVIATRVGAFEAQVNDPATGRLIPPGDTGALAAAMQAMLSDPAALAVAGQAARARVEAQFDIRGEATALEAVYRGLLA
jgi:mannosyltransferase